jgi:nucleotide-binding universal stress UspA family protein
VEILTLHVGDAKQPAPFEPAQDEALVWRHRSRGGDVVEGILAVAAEQPADLIVMATAGHDSILDGLRGSMTEQVLHGATCPLLAVRSD